VTVREVATGIWHWQAAHPDWTEADDPANRQDGWPRDVSCYAIDTIERLLLIDPLALPPEGEELASGREVAIVLTCTWHARDAVALAERLDASLHVPPSETPSADPLPGEVFQAGDSLPIGVRAFAGLDRNDLVLWIESRRALAAGDTLIDREDGKGLVLPETWLREGMSRDEALEVVRPLLDLPVEVVLPTHGMPTDRAALERALA
jgi:glyoxylase-like metal-dependent hydrolase (beta-lactamase superfamily II)